MEDVSVIIPVCNAEHYVESAIQSALCQHDVSMEVIVIDDGSRDGTWQRLAHFGDKIQARQQTNSGPAAARNHGSRLAKGDWLAFLDADDEWTSAKLAKQLAKARIVGADMVYSERLNIGRLERIVARQSEAQELPEGDVFEALLLGNFVTLSSVIIRRASFERLGGFAEGKDFFAVEDWEFLLRYAEHGRVAVCREPLVRYRWHAVGISNNLEHLSQARARVVSKALASARGRTVSCRKARQALAAAWECSAWYALPTQRWNAFQWYLRAAAYWPFKLQTYKGMIKCCIGRA